MFQPSKSFNKLKNHEIVLLPPDTVTSDPQKHTKKRKT